MWRSGHSDTVVLIQGDCCDKGLSEKAKVDLIVYYILLPINIIIAWKYKELPLDQMKNSFNDKIVPSSLPTIKANICPGEWRSPSSKRSRPFVDKSCSNLLSRSRLVTTAVCPTHYHLLHKMLSFSSIL